MPEDGAAMIARQVAIFVVLVGVAGCASAPKLINDDYGLVLPEDEYRARLEAWFNCDECANGQLRRVQELGDAAVSDLAEAKSGSLIQIGADDIMLADSDAILTERCTRFTMPPPTGIVPPGVTPAQTMDECVERFKENRDRRYRARATEALLAIRTESACRQLGVDANGVRLCLSLKPFYPPAYIPETGRSTRSMGLTVP